MADQQDVVDAIYSLETTIEQSLKRVLSELHDVNRNLKKVISNQR